ncbi:putative tyrosyl-DNA phosphodiesterase [Tolypocladium ophioglossoides CBS 100239]|uniref:Putative tyrosyl-DNA phosphodiesterase n=1 Tax=Tolypocladium ophioglossoides (strain CBS 100239) TaxID=1163406 RepID=A0A0L0NGS6_TOLOC|nr:putative tyrosyl-DNA phosphodiesterase [Tolypocladium ophioglossoides CBS 100239]
MNRPAKRQRTDGAEQASTPDSLSRPITPPRSRQRREARIVKSPWQLTWIRDLPEELNRDAVSLKDVLGDPLIRECWEFNFLHDIPFLMDAFDPDTRHLVKVHVVHGFWKQEDPRRLMLSVSATTPFSSCFADILQQDASEFDNVQLHVAPMPEMFGTHHSKMMVLLRHGDTAQVIVHTANMIAKDWINMTNAVWPSPLLPKLSEPNDASQGSHSSAFGSGDKFKSDLLSYLRSYDRRKLTCSPLVDELSQYDFSSIRAALVASVPGRHDVHDLSETAWGWAALKKCLRCIPCVDGDSEIVVQVSSIATLGAKDDWLQKTLFDSLATCKKQTAKRSKFKVVFPTADEIRQSIDGYASGGSIYTKIQSPQQVKQLQYLLPMFHRWANDGENGRELPSEAETLDGGRQRAAPHIKTYMRYNDKKTVDWAMLTSANLSKQAWG